MDIDLNYFIQNSFQRGEYSSIDEIDKLTINSTTAIDDILSLKSLKKLQIVKMFNDEYEYPSFIDYSSLTMMSSLEELYITENVNIKSLDLRNLKQLTTLVLLFNSNLEEIIGLEELSNLKKIIIVGNQFNEIKNMQKYLIKTQNTELNVLGIEFYHPSVGSKQLYNLYKSLFELKRTNLKFAENTSVGGLYFYSPGMINNIYKKSLKILSSITDDSASELEKIKSVYKYIISNVEYDHDGLSKRNDEWDIHFFSKPFQNDNIYREINTSYHAIQRKKAVCEGYSNMFNLLLGILGIRSETITCKLKSDDGKHLNHNASKILINGDWYYCDSQKEIDVDKLQYFFKTKEEFLQTHDLSTKDLKTNVKEFNYEKNITRNVRK